MKKCLLPIVAIAGLTAALVPTAHSANLYWDSNGSTAGAGATPTGTWGTDSFWNTSSAGTAGTFTSGMAVADVGFFSAGTDAVNPYTVTVNGTQASGSLTFEDGTPTLTGGTIALGAGKTLTAQSTLTGAATIESAITVDTTTATTLTFTANDGAGATDLLIKGGISANGANTYQLRFAGAGNTRIEGAIANHGAALGSSGWTGTVTIAGSQTLGASTGITLSTANNKLVMGDTTSDVQSWGGTTTVSASTALMTIKSNASAGPITLRGGGGMLDVTGTLSATGLQLGDVSNNFGVLKLSGGNVTFTGAGSGYVVNGTGSKIIGGAATYGTLTMNTTSGVTFGSGVTLGGSGTYENNFNLVKAGAATLTLNGTNTFSGSTTINGGIVSLGNNLALQNSAIDTAGSGTMTLTVATPTLGGLIGSKNLSSVMTTGYSSVSALTLNPGDSVTNSYSGNITNGAAGMTLTKTGNGTQVLSGSNSYTGATTVSAGTLLINGNQSAATGAVTVAAGAILGGNGTIGGATTITGILSPGNSVGTLNISNNTTWAGASSGTSATDWKFELGASNAADLLNITGNFSKDTGAGSVFRFDFQNSAATGTFKLVDWTGSTGFSATDFSYTNLSLGNTGTFQINGTQLDFVVVPEPSAWALVACSLTFLFVMRRRRLA